MGASPVGEPVADISKDIRQALPTPNRVMAPFRWYGGKGQLAKWIMPLIPQGKIYVEPFAGAASLLFNREPKGVEVLNDVHTEIVNLFRVLQDKQLFDELAHRLTWTMYSREEFRKALRQSESGTEVDRAWAFFVRQNQGFSGKAETEGEWSRAFTESRGMAEASSGWRLRLNVLDWWHDRLSRVQIDNVCAIKCIAYWDSPDTMFYVDPPYVLDTRAGGKAYKHEQDNDFHGRLVDALLRIEGNAVLSGYETPLYERLTAAGWKKHMKDTACHAVGKIRGTKLRGKGSGLKHAARTEVLWVKRQDDQETLPLYK